MGQAYAIVTHPSLIGKLSQNTEGLLPSKISIGAYIYVGYLKNQSYIGGYDIAYILPYSSVGRAFDC